MIREDEAYDEDDFLLENLDRILCKKLSSHKKFHEGIEMEKQKMRDKMKEF